LYFWIKKQIEPFGIHTSYYMSFYHNLCYFRKDGYLYDKEAIISYILQKKREIARKLKEYERQKDKVKVIKDELL